MQFKILKEGPGLPIVFLHGFLGNALDWTELVSFLPKSLCIAFDLPGHGDSPFTEETQISLSRFHLVGYSMGGRIALEFARRYPEKIASLTLLSTHPGLSSKKEKIKRKKSDELWAKKLLTLPIDDFLKQWYDQPLFKTFKPDFSVRRKQNIPALVSALLHFSLSKQMKFEVDQVLIGEKDFKFRSFYKTPILIPNSGHCIPLENPQYAAHIIEQRIFK